MHTSFGLQDQIAFTKRLSLYLSAGVPILEALHLITERMHASSLVHTLKSHVAEGHTLSSSLELSAPQIPGFVIAMIQVGEHSGTLPRTLEEIAVALRKRQALRTKALGSLIYPCIIVTAVLGISGFLVFYAFPKITPLFRGFGAELPFATRALIAFTDTITAYGVWAVAAMLVLGIGIAFLMRDIRVQRIRDRMLLSLPLVGVLWCNYYRTHSARTLHTLLRSGIGIVMSLELTSNATAHHTFSHALIDIKDEVLMGERMSHAFEKHSLCFPQLFVDMVRTGERTGSLPHTFETLAAHYEDLFETQSAQLTTLIEPVLMVSMGLLVGFIALAIITPVYQVTQHLHV